MRIFHNLHMEVGNTFFSEDIGQIKKLCDSIDINHKVAFLTFI